ncbi:hypothetical protein GCM10027160_51050 [Streptomyces calidiresistens]|uniref:Uncharacterized protein n=1 Tax=Streptomyces calidiresistens TaxID=1485586 RepID=A0A7W3T617_9ACTN|nr:hypothetical protein [Streptomyces calidiresistens]MBB0231585.1 hypothetical protein [Streptomyces calidiresistens]
MTQPGEGTESTTSRPTRPRFRKPASLTFEPPAQAVDAEHFFGLESVADPQELLERSTDLAVAFRDAAERAVEYQAMAAARLTDPRRFDRLTEAQLAERAGWGEDYARRMVDFGRRLERGDPTEGE